MPAICSAQSARRRSISVSRWLCLIFEDFDAFDQARLALRDGTFVKFGEETGPIRAPDYGAYRFTRVAGPTPDAPDVYSPFKNGWVSPDTSRIRNSRYGHRWRCRRAALCQGRRSTASRSALNLRRAIRPFWCWTANSRPIRRSDVSRAGMRLAWYDAGRKNLELVLGVQSPFETAESIVFLLGEAIRAFKPTRINTQFAYVGGGFGGRDHTPFPLYVALAGMFFPDRPVRLAYNRFEQFQIGHQAARIQDTHADRGRSRDRQDYRIRRRPRIATAAASPISRAQLRTLAPRWRSASMIFRRVDVTTVSPSTRAASPRGRCAAMACCRQSRRWRHWSMKCARRLPLDPIDFRRRNALKTGGRTLSGNQYDRFDPHAGDSGQAREASDLAAACRGKGPGQSGDSRRDRRCLHQQKLRHWGGRSLGAVEIGPDGRIAIRCDGAEMGNGIGTAVANRVAAYLGGVADEVALAQVDAFGPLALVTSGDPYTIDQKAQDAAARNPRWVPEITSATAASTGAHVGTHAAAEAARVIFRFGLWPAALDLWRIAPKDRRAQWQTAHWSDGHLIMSGLSPLALADVAARAHAKNGITGAMAHGFNRWAWSQADFKIDGQNWTADIDALAVRRGAGKFVRLDRTSVKFPPTNFIRIGTTYTAQCGTLARVEINRSTGALRIAKAYCVFECGTALVPQIVIGQAQGAFAMCVGGAFLETLPLYEDGPGNGKWNLGQYLVARGSDLPLRDLEIEVLPPLDVNERPKGMAESVMNPGRRRAVECHLRRHRPSLPFLAGDPRDDQGSADVTTLSVTINGRTYGPSEVRDELTMNDYLREYLGLTGTKFGCGAAQCLSCAVIVDDPDGTSYTSPTCMVPAVNFNGKSIRTVEGHAKEWRAYRFAEGVHRALRLSMRLLYGRLPQRRPGSARTFGKKPVARADLRKRLPKRSTAIYAAAPVTSNITRPFTP